MTTVELKLDASTRADQGKGASRRLRRAKKIPAILYGAGRDAVSLSLDEQQVLRLMREETFFSQILDVAVDGKVERVILKDMQRHPFKPLVTHMDLLRITAGEKMRQHVPLHFLNEETAKGVKEEGGVIHRNLIEVEVECLPEHLPTYIEVDVAALGLDETFRLSELRLPEGVVLPALEHDPEHDPGVVSIHPPRKTMEEEEAAEAEEAGQAEPEEGREGGEEKKRGREE